MKRKLLALDIGKVCILLQEEMAMAAMNWKSMGDIPPVLMAEVEKLECGKVDHNDFFATVSTLLGRGSEQDLRSWFNLVVGNEMPGMAKALKAMAEEWDFVFLSDISYPHLQEAKKRLSFFDQAKGGIYSFEVGCRKPEAGMYLAFEEKYGKPDLYVDDRQCNIDAAEKLGWHSAIFTDINKFLNDIKL